MARSFAFSSTTDLASLGYSAGCIFPVVAQSGTGFRTANGALCRYSAGSRGSLVV